MATIPALIAAFLISPAQGAPPDVPKNHWAHAAVDELFQEGLLKGYPSGQSPQLKLDKKAAMTVAESVKVARRWKDQGLMGGYPEGHRTNREPSRYEIAVAVHATWANVRGILQEGKERADILQSCRNEIPAIAHAISAYNFELTKLGADTQEMIAALNDLRDGPNRPFHG